MAVLSVKLVTVGPTVAICDHEPLAEVARSIWMPSASAALSVQLNVSANNLVEQANHARTNAVITTAQLRMGREVLELFPCRALILKCVLCINSCNLTRVGSLEACQRLARAKPLVSSRIQGVSNASRRRIWKRSFHMGKTISPCRPSCQCLPRQGHPGPWAKTATTDDLMLCKETVSCCGDACRNPPRRPSGEDRPNPMVNAAIKLWGWGNFALGTRPKTRFSKTDGASRTPAQR